MSACAKYDIGDTVKLTVTFTQNGVATDPPTVRCRVISPLGVETVYTYGTDANLVRTGAGTYECYVGPDRRGIWQYRWEAIDSAAIQIAKRGAEEGRFLVRETSFS